MTGGIRAIDQGPFLVAQLRSGEPHELSHGHLIRCAPAGGSGSRPKWLGASVVGWDPLVTEAGIDTGYELAPDMLRAPDVAIGNVPGSSGWVKGVPALGIEYVDIGRDENELEEKIRDLLAFGTRYLWVVRLTGRPRVEVYEAGKWVCTALPGAMLTAPGVLKNPVRVESLYDPEEAERTTLVNLLQRRGYDGLEAVLAAGRREGREEGLKQGREEGRQDGIKEGYMAALLAVLDARGLRIGQAARERIEACDDLGQLDVWIRRAATLREVAELFEEG